MQDTINRIENLGEEMIAEWESPSSLSEMEQRIRRIMLWIGNIMLRIWLVWEDRGQSALPSCCPDCGTQMSYQRRRKAQLLTSLGKISYRRTYHLCEVCQQGHSLLDERLGLRPNQMSAELERLAGLVGVQTSFGKGSQLLEELLLIKLSDHSLDKSAQAYGREVEQVEQEWQSEAADAETQLKRQREARPVLRLYGALDGAVVHVRGDKQNAWRELKIGAWFQARGQPPKSPDGQWRIQAENITYYADFCEASTFGNLLWASGLQRQADMAVELIFIGDGAAWIWRLVEEHYPQAIQIVDWFHASQYLNNLARHAFPDVTARQHWLETTRTALWEGQLDMVIDACQAQIQSQLAAEDDPAQQAVTYFTNNRQRMDYPTYRANGYQIGSGTIESAAKQIVAHRMRVMGATWNLDSARAVAKARAAFLSQQWNYLATRRALAA
jgi:hypothetical protein